jgi:lipooligosaccharide transport system permease protein
MFLAAMGLGLGAFLKEINGVPYVNFIAPGIMASSAMYAATFECTYGTYVRMTFQKTFDAILATPVSVEDLVAAELLWAACKSVLYSAIILIVISAFGLVASPWVLLSIPGVFVAGVVFAELAVITTALVPGIDSYNYYFTLFLTPMFLFSGIFFPLDGMPAWVGAVAAATPLYNLVNICRESAMGHPASTLLNFGVLVLMASALSPLPFRLMRRRMIP